MDQPPQGRGDRLSLAVVFLLSRRCNLQCTYCNVDAGPRVRGGLDPVAFEAWVASLAGLGNLDIGVQLHGGEPLMVQPPAEAYAAIARNAVVPFASARIGAVSLVTNGLLLDRERARSLRHGGINVVVSIDGPPDVHDRCRRTADGRGSHAGAVAAMGALREEQMSPGVIAVVSRPGDVAAAFDYLMADGVRRFRINPVRPEGRGADGEGVAASWVRAMAEQHAEMAERIAGHNASHPTDSVYEENVQILTARAAGRPARRPATDWTVLVDETGALWSHPGGRGVGHMQLLDGRPSTERVAHALGLARPPTGPGGRRGQLLARRRATYRPCPSCTDPDGCAEFRPVLRRDPCRDLDPECRWRTELARRLEEWWRADPARAELVIRPAEPLGRTGGKDTEPAATPAPMPTGLTPLVRALVGDVRASPSGRLFVGDYAAWVGRLSESPEPTQATDLVQLVGVAGWYAAQGGDAAGVGRSLAQLARVGLAPMVRARSAGRPPAGARAGEGAGDHLA